MERCFACNRPLGKRSRLVDTRDGQTVYVGLGCFKEILRAGNAGYLPPLGGPRLYPIRSNVPTFMDSTPREPRAEGSR